MNSFYLHCCQKLLNARVAETLVKPISLCFYPLPPPLPFYSCGRERAKDNNKKKS